MDDLARYNRERWNALVAAGVEYSRPWLDLTPSIARERLDPRGWLGEVTGARVLCLANGGGQQSAAFAMLGARVTVFDLSDAQLSQDRRAAEHFGHAIRIEPGDMRDLARFEPDEFDLVWQSYSINFVPDPAQVFAQVSRVLRAGGRYVLNFSNPHRYSIIDETWQPGLGYGLTARYRDGEVVYPDDNWDVEQEDGGKVKVRGPREFNHTWSMLINSLADLGFVIRHASEWMRTETDVADGSWEHFTQVLPPYMTFWMTKNGAT